MIIGTQNVLQKTKILDRYSVLFQKETETVRKIHKNIPHNFNNRKKA